MHMKKEERPKVISDFRNQDYVQTTDVCGNITYVRNYEMPY
jgi:translation elongation factor EF-Tu-like GTPase